MSEGRDEGKYAFPPFVGNFSYNLIAEVHGDIQEIKFWKETRRNVVRI